MKILINIIAVILGVLIGGIVNMLIINYGPTVIPNPEGFLNANMDEMLQTIHLLEPKHYLIPWLAHAIGTFVGAVIAFKIAKTKQFYMAITVSVFFFIGGLIMIVSIPSPIWFTMVDLGFAYIPMAWLARKIFSKS